MKYLVIIIHEYVFFNIICCVIHTIFLNNFDYHLLIWEGSNIFSNVLIVLTSLSYYEYYYWHLLIQI